MGDNMSIDVHKNIFSELSKKEDTYKDDIQQMLLEDCKIMLKANFWKGIEENEWRMRIVLDKTRDADSQVYTFGYIMPKSNLPLELIAATGLKYFQLYLKEEIQTKSEYDFMLGDVLKGM